MEMSLEIGRIKCTLPLVIFLVQHDPAQFSGACVFLPKDYPAVGDHTSDLILPIDGFD